MRFCLGDFWPGVEKCTALRRCSSSSPLPSLPSPLLPPLSSLPRRSSHRRLPHRCTLAFVAGGSRLRRSRRDMKNPGDLVEISGIRFPGCAGLELVGCADIDENRILVVLSGLDHPLEACREVPVAGYREVGAAAQIDAARPSADIVGAQTRLRIDMPVRAILKRYCTSALMSTEQNFLQMAMMPDSMRQLSVKL